MKIWVDGDACPRAVKELTFRAAQRLSIDAVMVANKPMRIPQSHLIRLQVVEDGFNQADDHIVAQVCPGDLVIAEDIPLAARVVEAGGTVINPRGFVYTADNVKQKLAERNLLSELRDSGMISGGPAPFNKKNRAEFASALDRTLNKLLG